MQTLRKATVQTGVFASRNISLFHVTDTSEQKATVFEDSNLVVAKSSEAWLVDLPFGYGQWDSYYFTTAEKADAFFVKKIAEMNAKEVSLEARDEKA